MKCAGHRVFHSIHNWQRSGAASHLILYPVARIDLVAQGHVVDDRVLRVLAGLPSVLATVAAMRGLRAAAEQGRGH
jgi:hypothetical protein